MKFHSPATVRSQITFPVNVNIVGLQMCVDKIVLVHIMVVDFECILQKKEQSAIVTNNYSRHLSANSLVSAG